MSSTAPILHSWDTYVQRLTSALSDVRDEEVGRIITLLTGLRQSHGTVYILGNGGSEANASHFSLHLRECGLNAHDIHAELPMLTAWSNDHDYSTLGMKTLRSLACKTDLLVVITGSGDSPNVLVTLAEARRIGMVTIGLLGFGGGAAESLCELNITIGLAEYGPVEDAHSAIIHYIKGAVSPLAARPKDTNTLASSEPKIN